MFALSPSTLCAALSGSFFRLCILGPLSESSSELWGPASPRNPGGVSWMSESKRWPRVALWAPSFRVDFMSCFRRLS